MKALVKYGRNAGEVEVQTVPDPTPGPDQVLVKVQTAGVCGSDIHLLHERQSWPIKLPLVMGHEFSGIVAQVGEQVTGFQSGERVTCETAATICGRCTYCMSGDYNLCPERTGYGALADGAFAEYVVARPQILHHIPERVPFEHAALTEPACVAYNALVEKATIEPGSLVVIQGVGAIGIMALQTARLSGAGIIVALGTDSDAERLETARTLGADFTLNIQQDNAAELVESLGDGFGADTVVDCTGSSHALLQALDCVRPNGQIVKIGWGPLPLDFSLDLLVAKAVRLQGTFSHTYPTWERVLALMSAGAIDLDTIIGGIYTLEEWCDAFTSMEKGTSMKSVLRI